MLTDNQIEKLIQPVLNRQSKIEMMVLLKIADRVKDIGTMTPSDVKALEQLYKSGSDVRAINKELARLTKLNERQVRKIIRTVAADNYKDAEPYYNYRKRRYVPLEQNAAMQSVISAMESVTASTYKNISRSTALRFLWRDLTTGALTELLSMEEAYQRAVDTAIQAVTLGVTDYNTAMQKTLQNLVSSGINTVEYQSENGRITHQRLDTAVRRNLLDGIRMTSQAMQDEIGKQVGADGVELSVHAMSAPDHEPIQGHQFTEAEFEKCQTQQAFEDVNGIQFAPIARPIGVWNCRHFAYNIIIGVQSPTYTLEQLEELKKKNAKGYTYTDSKGQEHHLSLYECTQRQRQYELAIRKAREGKALAERAENDKLSEYYNKRLKQKMTDYQTFSSNCKLKTQYSRTKIVI
mgnify:CR=1 FL=1